MKVNQRPLRCAIYTRKSTEEGLDMDYNSLDAQRDACLAYIASQKSEGWQALPEVYDDGGYSGGTLERPALQRLLAEIRAGALDVIVVYKIDRLSRSLTDFARLVELFDRQRVTFVSVTQQFNTTTSMGRLTLNILLSFAQFERELAGERVRDKIAASRQRGLWMGGMPPLGYDVVERKLVPNAEEAARVRHIFERFVALGSVTTLAGELRRQGYTTKTWTTLKGKARAGRLLDKGDLYKLLRNPVFVGIAAYKGQHYPGEHEAILDRALWEQAQQMLDRGDVVQRAAQARSSQTPALLKGIIRASDGRAMTPGATKKGDKVYRYYVNTATIKIGKDACEVPRVPAGEVEALVVGQVRRILQAPQIAAHVLRELAKKTPGIEAKAIVEALRSIDAVWETLFPLEQARIVQLLVQQVIVSPDGVRIEMKQEGLEDLIRETMAQPPMKEAA